MGKGSRNRAAAHKPAAAQATPKTSLGIKLAFIGVAVLCLVALVYYIITGTGMLQRNTTAMRVSDDNVSEEFSAAYMDILYYNVRADIVSQYYYYLYLYGYSLDSSLDAMPCIFDNSITFREYFLAQAKEQALQMMVLKLKGEDENFQPEDPDGWKDLVQELKDLAEENDMSVEKYIKQIYGKALDLDTVTSYYKLNHYASSYYEKVFAKEFTADEKDAYYKENADSYDVFDVYLYSFTYETYTYTAPAEGETVADGQPKSEEEATQMSEASKTQAETDAKAFLERLKNGENFDDIAKEYFDKKAKEEAEEGEEPETFTTALLEDDLLSTFASTVQTWLKSASRVKGDKEVLTDSTNKIYYVVKLVDRHVNPAQAASVRHILLSYEELNEIPDTATADEKKELEEENAEIEKFNQEQYEKAQKLLDEWKKGDADEDSFAALVADNSEDTGSVDNGGLYEKFSQGDMVEAFDQWCFDETRKYGDTGLVETEYGVHIMFYVSDDGDYYQHVLLEDMRAEEYDLWYLEASADYEVEYNAFGLSLVNN